MKVLECDRCHKLFKTTDIHMATYLGGGRVINFCMDCTFRFVLLAGETLDNLDKVME